MTNEQQVQVVYNYLDKTNFCAMPFFHITIESNGDVKPCCLAHPLKNQDGTNLNIAEKSISDIIDHPTHIEFRESFLNNQNNPACKPCWGKFQNDKFSGRYMYSVSSLLIDKVLAIANNESAPKQNLLWLEIKAGNRCNLACRICGLWNSSKWLKETYDINKSLKKDYPIFKQSPELFYNRQAKWIDDIDFWRNVDKFDDIRIIHLMGGEPLMIREHYEMLKIISERFDPKQIDIWYNTNGTIIPNKEDEELYSKFKNIIWFLSIDDFGDKFEYQRKGGSWNEVKENLKYFCGKTNYKTTLDPTISVFNIFTLDEFLMEVQDMQFITSIIPHYVTSVDGIWNVRGLHSDVKQVITQHLTKSKSKIQTKYHKIIDDALEFMNSIDFWSEDLDKKRQYEIDFIDKARNESFVKTFSKMAKLLNYE
jgi:MoaA/NifB/PqqE/SkfB family radical SAM enzyme